LFLEDPRATYDISWYFFKSLGNLDEQMKALKGLFNKITAKFGLEIKERSIYNLQQRGIRA